MILDEFIAVTGCHHKSAIRTLNAEPIIKRRQWSRRRGVLYCNFLSVEADELRAMLKAETPAHGQDLLAHRLMEMQMPIALQGRQQNRQQRSKAFPAYRIRSLPEHDQRSSDRFVIQRGSDTDHSHALHLPD